MLEPLARHTEHTTLDGGWQDQLKLDQAVATENPSLSPTVLLLTVPKPLVIKMVNKITQHT